MAQQVADPLMDANARRWLEHGREWHEVRMAEERAVQQQRRRRNMTTRETKVGDLVTRFPSTSGLLAEVEALRQELIELYDAAEEASERDARMRANAHPDTGRFPAAGGA